MLRFVLELPQWVHEVATLATLALASGYLAVHLARISRPGTRASSGCSRCEHNAAPAPATPTRGRRSKRLRVL